ncbi:MAG: hypothetical protein ACRC7V_03905 [Lachnospiraceae bacterium]
MKEKKKFSILFMLIAGAITSFFSFWMKSELDVTLIRLLVVLILFYFLGIIYEKLLEKIEGQVSPTQELKDSEEGNVVEKE